MEIDNIRNIELCEIDSDSDSDNDEDENDLRVPKRYIRDWLNPFEFYSNQEFKRFQI